MRTTTPHQPAPPPHRITSDHCGTTDNTQQWYRKHREHLAGAALRQFNIPLERVK